MHPLVPLAQTPLDLTHVHATRRHLLVSYIPVFKFAKTDIKATDIHVPMSMSAKAHIHVLEQMKFVSITSEATLVAVLLVIQ